MKQRKIAVIAGTSDATDWIRSLPETDSVTAFVATPYGKEILAGTNCTVHVGRLDAAGFAEALTGFDEVAPTISNSLPKHRTDISLLPSCSAGQR